MVETNFPPKISSTNVFAFLKQSARNTGQNKLKAKCNAVWTLMQRGEQKNCIGHFDIHICINSTAKFTQDKQMNKMTISWALLLAQRRNLVFFTIYHSSSSRPFCSVSSMLFSSQSSKTCKSSTKNNNNGIFASVTQRLYANFPNESYS